MCEIERSGGGGGHTRISGLILSRLNVRYPRLNQSPPPPPIDDERLGTMAPSPLPKPLYLFILFGITDVTYISETKQQKKISLVVGGEVRLDALKKGQEGSIKNL